MRVTRWTVNKAHLTAPLSLPFLFLSLSLFFCTTNLHMAEAKAAADSFSQEDLWKRFVMCLHCVLFCSRLSKERGQRGIEWEGVWAGGLSRKIGVRNRFDILLFALVPFLVHSISLLLLALSRSLYFLSLSLFSSHFACSLRRNAVQGKAFLATCLLSYSALLPFLFACCLLPTVSTRTLAWQSLHSANDWRWFVCVLKRPNRKGKFGENCLVDGLLAESQRGRVKEERGCLNFPLLRKVLNLPLCIISFCIISSTFNLNVAKFSNFQLDLKGNECIWIGNYKWVLRGKLHNQIHPDTLLHHPTQSTTPQFLPSLLLGPLQCTASIYYTFSAFLFSFSV